MIKSSKYSFFRIFMVLCFAVMFSCTSVTTPTVETGKRKLATPTASITTREVDYGTVVKFSYTPNDANLFYTLDGTIPEVDGDSKYYNPNEGIKLDESCTITARIFHSNYEASDCVSFTYNVVLPEPKISPEKTDIDTETDISIKSPIPGAEIYYLVDSNVELNENNGISNDEPFNLPEGKHIVRFIAIKGKSKSEIVEHIYNVADKDGIYLDKLTVSAGNVNFSKTETEYSFNVDYNDSSVVVTAESKGNEVKIAGESTTTKTVNLEVGENTVEIVVTSMQDSMLSKTYILKIKRASENPSDDATLAKITLTSGNVGVPLSPIFSSTVEKYTATVENEVTSVNVAAVTTDSKASAAYDKECLLKIGENTIKIEVTAEKTSVKKVYEVVVTRKEPIVPGNAKLKSFTVDGVYVPVNEYGMSYETAANEVSIVATPEDEKITSLKINGIECTGTTVNVPSVVTVVIVAADGLVTKSYTVDITKKSNVELKSVSVNGTSLSVSKNMNFVLATASAELILEVSGGVKSVKVDGQNVTSTKTATIQISSNDSLAADKNVSIELVANDGTSKTYLLALKYNPPITDKIIIHAYDYINIYTWENGNSSLEKKHQAMTQEGSSKWYTITLNVTKSNIIFSKEAGGWNNQTGNLSREAGEWWYKDGKWTEYNPEDSEAPVLVEFTSDKTGTVSGNVTLTVSATDNIGLSKAEFKSEGKVIGTATMSEKSATVDFILDTENLENKAHKITATVYDTAGKASNTIDLNIVTNNENPAPIAVISGASTVGLGATKTYSASSSKDKNGKVVGYKWTVSGGATVSGSTTNEEITVTAPNAETTFTIALVVTDNDGKKSAMVSQVVSVKPKVSGDFREESIYFLMTARFYDGDSSNNRYCRADDKSGNRENNDHPWRGDFKGLIEKLDYIKAMGFSAIWITPPVLNRSDFDFHGYHAWDMTEIDPRLESSGATYQDLINEAHKRDMKVIQDIVLNHSCRYGLKDFFEVKYWGDRDNQYWGKNSDINYYDEYTGFEYDGITVEPNSGKSWYNGDLWQKEKPNLPWNPDLSDWGVELGYNNENRPYYGCQWPTLKLFDPEKFHPEFLKNWEDETCQTGTIHEDCIDLNTESKVVQEYLIDAYTKYIEMGVDGFRIDTVKHISRLTFNRRFIPAFKDAGGENFYMFGEVCTRVNEVWNKGVAPLSTPFYTWKERKNYSADDEVAVHEAYNYEQGQGSNNQPTSDNHALKGNNYHEPDYSKSSGMAVIDFPMHWNFDNAGQAYNMRGNDHYYNDATWNVVYVDSHDYGPNMDNRYSGGTDAWAENMTYMWTFRGIPCIYYGSEIEFQAGAPTDKGPSAPLASTGRAYFGDHIEGSVTATDFGEWTNASGAVAATLEKPLPKHLADLNKIRRAVPALQKGQYSNDGCNGSMAFKRRFTKNGVDSFVLVTISGGATFSGVPGGTYVDVVTGDKKTVSEGGTLSASCSGSGNARIYVLQNQTAKDYGADKKIAGKSQFLK